MAHDEPWHIDPAGWPAEGSAAERLGFALRYAILAPSGHNTQPWRFHHRGETLELLADRSRRLPVVDPQDRALVISCGAALALLVLALRRFGCAGAVALLPDSGAPDLLARIGPGAPHACTAAERRLFEAIPHRHTVRGPHRADPLPEGLADALRNEGAAQGVEVSLVTDPAPRARVAALVEKGDRAQFADPAFRAELADWVKARSLGARDGISGRSFGLPDLLSPGFAWAIRHLDLGRSVGTTDRSLAEAAPALLLLATPRDAPPDWLAAGHALAMMLLEATACGVRAAFLNQPVEVPSLRPRLRDAAGLSGHPQLLLRLGLAEEGPPSARRAATDVTEGADRAPDRRDAQR